jgi:hypothetical protein
MLKNRRDFGKDKHNRCLPFQATEEILPSMFFCKLEIFA